MAVLEATFTVARRFFDVAASIVLRPGERFSLFGPSGAGKSTCLEATAGLVPLTQGRVLIAGGLVNVAPPRRIDWRAERPMPPRKRSVSLIRQPTTLFPHLSIRDNVGYGTSRSRAGDAAIEEVLLQVGLDGLANASPATLSGGQRQRAALARAIVRPFRVLLMDEPFGSVDGSSRARLRDIAAAAAERADAAALLVTHDLGEAQAFGHVLGIMDGGSFLQVGPAEELVRRPVSRRVAELVGYTGFLRHDRSRMWALHPDRFAPGAWPERGLVIRGEVTSVQAFGPRYVCELRTSCDFMGPTAGDGPRGGGSVRVHVDAPPRVGEGWEATALGPPLVVVSDAAAAADEEEHGG